MTDSISSQMPKRWRWSAWVYLLITLISGTLLRYQWTGHAVPFFDSGFLLHGHSHLALLGWTFVAVFGLMFRQSWYVKPSLSQLGFEILFHMIIVGMFLAFIIQGYAFWSILLSMTHILLTFFLILVYVRKVRIGIPEMPRNWLDISLFWMVVSTLGPWMLSMGTMMGADWIDFWVGYYLTLTFNGWLTFAVIGLIVWQKEISIPNYVRDMMAIGVLPAFFARAHELFHFPGLDWLGWLGAILFGIALILAAWHVFLQMNKEKIWYPVILGMFLTGLLIAIGSFPGLADQFYGIRMLTIGFVHLHLLGFVSAGLYLLVFSKNTLATATFFTGSWLMILLLLLLGGLQWLGVFVFWPAQWLMTGFGIIAMIGVVIQRPA